MDTDTTLNPALLPAGLADLLPPDAETEANAVGEIMAVFASHGYARVRPPLLEFEEALLAGAGAVLADQIFRVMDPDSHRMMGLRADITPQIARIAATRLADSPRPLRLSYTGQCIRTRGRDGARDGDRQVPQAGIELIGHDSAAADTEAMLAGIAALDAVGITGISIDLTLPALAPMIVDGLVAAGGIKGDNARPLKHALDRKDAAQVTALAGKTGLWLTALLLAAGPAGAALAAITAAPLPDAAAALTARLQDVVGRLKQAAPAVKITIDPLEFRGFGYHTGLAFTLYASGHGEELGRGGRYISTGGEAATGLTLFADSVLRAAPCRAARPAVFVPVGEDAGIARKTGFVAIQALAPHDKPADEAKRLGCTHLMRDGQPILLKDFL
jgi:ATP phosphoribosyltransferase regulatory subunit